MKIYRTFSVITHGVPEATIIEYFETNWTRMKACSVGVNSCSTASQEGEGKQEDEEDIASASTSPACRACS